MPRGRDKRPVVEPIRRKCATCGSVKVVKHRLWSIPPNLKPGTYNANTTKKERKDIPGATALNYCSIECGGDTFVNHYTADDFIRT